MTKTEYKSRPKGWSEKKTCRHCWYYRTENCGGKNCFREKDSNLHGYFTIQEYPKVRKFK